MSRSREVGEKTLIFCERVETIRALRETLNSLWMEEVASAWRFVFPRVSDRELWGEDEGSVGHHAAYQARFRRGTDSLHLALRENYVHTITDLPDKVLGQTEVILAAANRTLKQLRFVRSVANGSTIVLQNVASNGPSSSWHRNMGSS